MIERGEIYYINASEKPIGSEQWAGRPAVVVSNNSYNANSDTVAVVYLTTSPKCDNVMHVTIRSAAKLSTALCEQITCVSKLRIGDRMGVCTAAELESIDRAVAILLDIFTEDGDYSTAEPSSCSCTEECYEELLTLRAKVKVYKELLDDVLIKNFKGGKV